MTLFDQQWQTYWTVLDHDSTEPWAVADATAGALWAGAINAATLGHRWSWWIWAAVIWPIWRRCSDRCPCASYTGLDLAASVLPLAERQMGQAEFPCHWVSGDLLAWAEEASEPPVDLIHSAFAIHHLSDPDKVRFFKGAHRRIADRGLLVGPMSFREPMSRERPI